MPKLSRCNFQYKISAAGFLPLTKIYFNFRKTFFLYFLSSLRPLWRKEIKIYVCFICFKVFMRFKWRKSFVRKWKKLWRCRLSGIVNSGLRWKRNAL